jgi:hypothetical protein
MDLCFPLVKALWFAFVAKMGSKLSASVEKRSWFYEISKKIPVLKCQANYIIAM